jgi:hypothetical protein
MGGRKPMRSKPGILTVNNTATTTGMAIETIHIQMLYLFFGAAWFVFIIRVF